MLIVPNSTPMTSTCSKGWNYNNIFLAFFEKNQDTLIADYRAYKKGRFPPKSSLVPFLTKRISFNQNE